MLYARASVTMRSIARAHGRSGSGDDSAAVVRNELIDNVRRVATFASISADVHEFPQLSTVCGQLSSGVWMNLWSVQWTTHLVNAPCDTDDARVVSRGGRGVVGRAHRSSSDRLHHVLFRASRRRMAFPVRRDVLRGGQSSLSRAWVRGAGAGGSGLHAWW